jgi:BON domain/ROS/MUCR transcriptional regulator protein
VSDKELAYYRVHFREAVQKDGVICLECGAIFKYLPAHLCKHNLSSHEYRAKWGYNRTTPLERLITRRKKRHNALAMKLGSLSPRGSIEKAIKAKRGRAWPYRPESRLIQTEAARARVAAGFRRVEQRRSTVPGDGLALSKEDRQVLSLRNRGFGRARSRKAVKETFLKAKAVDLTDVNVRTTDGSVDLRGTVPSLEAREHAIKLAWKVAGVQAVVNHLEVKK